MRPCVNLIPAAVRNERLKRRRVRWWRMAVLAVWAAASIPVLGEALAAHQLNRQRSALCAATSALQQIEQAALDRERRLQALRADIARADALCAKRRWASLLSALFSAMPDSVWLVALASDPPEPEASTGMVASIAAALPGLQGNAGGAPPAAGGERPGPPPAAGAAPTAGSSDGPGPRTAGPQESPLRRFIGKNGPRRLVLECRALVLEDIFRFVSAVGALGIFDSAGVRSDSVRVEEVHGVKVTRFTLECGW